MVQLPPDSFLCVNVVKQRVTYCSINETRILRTFGAHHRDSRHIIAKPAVGFVQAQPTTGLAIACLVVSRKKITPSG